MSFFSSVNSANKLFLIEKKSLDMSLISVLRHKNSKTIYCQIRCKTSRNTANGEQKYKPTFLLLFSGSCIAKSRYANIKIEL